MKHPHTLHPQAGFSMVEVLVTIVIVSIGLLGMASLQLNSLRNNTSANDRSIATALGYDIIDRMRANSKAALDGSYATDLDTAPSDSVDCLGTASNCSASDLASHDLDYWKCSLGKWNAETACTDTHQIAGPLPNGDGAIVINGNMVTVTVQWEDNRTEEAAADRLVSLAISTEL